MPIPDFNAHGVLPPGSHTCNLPEIPGRYLNNQHRSDLWGDFESFLAWLADKPNPSILLIDGGFTSDKATPKDIDVVLDLSNATRESQDFWLRKFFTEREFFMENFRVDLWVYVPGAGKDLRAFFTYVKPAEAITRGMGPNDTKGMLRVEL